LPCFASSKWLLNPAWLALLAASLGAAILPGCGGTTAGSAAGAKPRVRVARPIVREVTEYVYYTGRLDAVQSVDIQARVTGYLQSVDFNPGSEVTAGQQLFLIDPRPYQATLDEALGQVKLAQARLQLAVADYQRGLEVAKTPGAISKQDLDKYAAAQSEASASVDAAKANSEAAKLNLEFTKITSPIDGRVGRNLLTLGNLVKQDSTLLTTVVSQDPMYAYFDVDEHTMLRVQALIRAGKVKSVRQGAEMPLQMGLANEGNEYPHQGQVDFVNNRVDPSTGTLQVRGTFANPPLGEKGNRLLSPGLFVRVRVPLGKPFRALLLPQAAVSTDQGLKYLLVVNKEGIVEYRPVSLGPQQPGGLQVIFPMQMVQTEKGLQLADGNTPAETPRIESLTQSDEVIVSGLQLVRPDMPVKTREVNITPGPQGLNSTINDSAPSAPAAKSPPAAGEAVQNNSSGGATPSALPKTSTGGSPAASEQRPDTSSLESPASKDAEPRPTDAGSAEDGPPATLSFPSENSPQNNSRSKSDGVFERAPRPAAPAASASPSRP
jgi:multidrug efflux system membrane fusion protein